MVLRHEMEGRCCSVIDFRNASVAVNGKDCIVDFIESNRLIPKAIQMLQFFWTLIARVEAVVPVTCFNIPPENIVNLTNLQDDRRCEDKRKDKRRMKTRSKAFFICHRQCTCT